MDHQDEEDKYVKFMPRVQTTTSRREQPLLRSTSQSNRSSQITLPMIPRMPVSSVNQGATSNNGLSSYRPIKQSQSETLPGRKVASIDSHDKNTPEEQQASNKSHSSNNQTVSLFNLDLPILRSSPQPSGNKKRWSECNLRKSSSKVVVATHNYSPSAKGDLAIKKGDILEIGQDGHLWWYAKNIQSGNEGYVPSNHVQPVGFKKDDGVRISNNVNMFYKPKSSSYKLAKAHANFTANGSDDLSFKAGDMFNVLNDASTWWYVRHEVTGQEGFIPRNYVQCVDEMTSE